MVSRGTNIEQRRPAPRLYLTCPCLGGSQPGDPAGLSSALDAALAAADVAAVLLRVAGAHKGATDERSLINHVKALAAAVQDRGVALLLEGHPDIVVKAGADGAHLSNVDEFEAAVAILKPDRIVGCGGLATRHDAMLAAEQGADYVMFGEPEDTGQRPSFDAILERIGWWAEVFEIPCVGFAASAEEIAPIAAAGAEFVAIGEWLFHDARGPARAIAEATSLLALTETVG